MSDKKSDEKVKDEKIVDNTDEIKEEPKKDDKQEPTVVKEKEKIVEKIGQVKVELEQNEKRIKELVNQAVEKTRKEEKDKLYSDIEGLKARNKELEAQMQQLGDGMDESALNVEKKLVEKMIGMENEVKELRKSLREKELEAYRQEMINKNMPLIEKMVRGNTKEEIDASIKVAKDEYKKIKEEVAKGEKKGETKPGVIKSPSVKVGELELTAEAISNMSLEEYQKYRKEILEKVG